MNKARYGIDAPPAIKQLALTAVISLIIGIVAYKVLAISYNTIAIIILATMIVFSIINIIFFMLMLWSSLFGKLMMRNKIVESLNLEGHEKVLDIGCGRGLLLHELAKHLNQGGKAVGLDLWRTEDLSNNQEALTRQNAELEGVSDRVELVSGDMTSMEFDDNQFDVVVSSMAIHNVETDDERHKAIQEISRVLKPGGTLIILDFQHTSQYLQSLQQLRWKEARLSRRYFIMFPPVRILTGIKPIQHTKNS